MKEEPEESVPSPCISVCVLDDDEVCEGCGRLADEVMAWPLAQPEQKLRIVAAAAQRLNERQAGSGK